MNSLAIIILALLFSNAALSSSISNCIKEMRKSGNFHRLNHKNFIGGLFVLSSNQGFKVYSEKGSVRVSEGRRGINCIQQRGNPGLAQRVGEMFDEIDTAGQENASNLLKLLRGACSGVAAENPGLVERFQKENAEYITNGNNANSRK